MAGSATDCPDRPIAESSTCCCLVNSKSSLYTCTIDCANSCSTCSSCSDVEYNNHRRSSYPIASSCSRFNNK